AHAAHKELIGSDTGRGRKTRGAGRSDNVVLINSVATDPNRSDQFAVLVKRNAARKDLQTIAQVRQRSTRRRAACQDRLQTGFDQIELQADVENTPLID